MPSSSDTKESQRLQKLMLESIPEVVASLKIAKDVWADATPEGVLGRPSRAVLVKIEFLGGGSGDLSRETAQNLVDEIGRCVGGLVFTSTRSRFAAINEVKTYIVSQHRQPFAQLSREKYEKAGMTEITAQAA